MERLVKARSDFRLAREAFSPLAAHLVPDMVLLGYAIEIDENIHAAELLLTNGFGHRAFPNVRAAYEAAQLAILLVTDNDYDLAGARAWLYHHHKDAGYVKMHGPTVMQGEDDMTPEQWLEAATREIADTWEDFSPGKRDVVAKASDILRRQRSKPDNWAGVSVASELAKRMEALAKRGGHQAREGVAKVYSAGYAALNRDTHPRTRFKPCTITGTINGAVSFVEEKLDIDRACNTVIAIAAGSLNHGVVAFNIRASVM